MPKRKAVAENTESAVADTKKTKAEKSSLVAIEHCVFKRKAAEVTAALSKGGRSFTINSTAPRRGAFVVTVDGNVVIELLSLKRPFTPLRELDVKEALSKYT